LKQGLLFRRKEAKDFQTLARIFPERAASVLESFLVLFFKKEPLAWLLLIGRPHRKMV
jgi:hypothetical protein